MTSIRAPSIFHVPNVHGSLVQSQVEIARSRHGNATVNRALDALTEAMRAEIAQAMPIAWVPVSSFIAYNEALAKELGTAVDVTHGELARIAIEKMIGTLWRPLLRLTGDEQLVSRTPVLYQRSYDTGALTSRFFPGNAAEASVSGWPDMPEFCIRGLRIGISTVLTLAGRKDVRIASHPTPDGALCEVSWRGR